MFPILKADLSVFFFLENTGRHQNNEVNAGNCNAQSL